MKHNAQKTPTEADLQVKCPNCGEAYAATDAFRASDWTIYFSHDAPIVIKSDRPDVDSGCEWCREMLFRWIVISNVAAADVDCVFFGTPSWLTRDDVNWIATDAEMVALIHTQRL